MTPSAEWFDHKYWGPGGLDISRWGAECQRGIRHHTTGAPMPTGTKGVVRKDQHGTQGAGDGVYGA